MSLERKLVTLLFTDIVGYSRMTESNEERTHEILMTHNRIVRECIATYHGREIRTIGDSFFIEFTSAVSAVECAVAIRERLTQFNQTLPSNLKLILRQGIHLGDVIGGEFQESHGTEVNIAARIQGLAPEGNICISEAVYGQVANKLPFKFTDIGEFQMKNILKKMRVYSVSIWEESTSQNLSYRIRSFFKQPASWSAVGLLLALFTGLLSFGDVWFNHISPSHSPDVFQAGNRNFDGRLEPTSLSDGWEILIEPGKNLVWQDYKSIPKSELIEKVHGEYWLRKKFELAGVYHEPTVVLGVISDRQQLFLDDKWFGSFDRAQPIPTFSIPHELASIGKHTLLVKAYTKGSITPGLNIIPSVGAWIGEDSEIESKVRVDWYLYHFPRIIYLGISLLFGLGLTLFYLFQPLRREILYASIYGLLGALALFCQNQLLCDGLPIQVMNSLKFFSVSMMSPVLLSAIFFRKHQPVAENRNNFLAGLLFHGVASASILIGEPAVSELIRTTDLYYGLTLTYALGAASYSIFTALRTKQLFSRYFVTGLFCLVHAAFCYVAIRNPSIPQVNYSVKHWIQQLFMLQPAIFATGVFLIYFKNSSYEIEKGQKLLRSDEWIQLAIHSSQDAFALHQEWRSQLGCKRSSLYWVDAKRNEIICLSHAPKTDVAPFERSSLSEHPALAWVVEQKRSVRLEQIPQQMKNIKFNNRYDSSSTMIITILDTEGQVAGLLTFSDPIGRDGFDDVDFRSSQIVAQILYQRFESQSKNQSKKLRAIA